MSSIIAWIKGLSLTAKIISAVVAGVVVIGGTTTAIIVATNSGGNDPADTGAPTSSVSESLTSETDSTDTSTAESEVTSSTEESSSTAASSQPDTTTSTPTTSTTPPTTSTPSTTETPQPAAFAVYINGKAVDLGTLERVNKKVSFRKEIEGAIYKDVAGDVYADAEKLVAALGMRKPTDQENSMMNDGASTFSIKYVAKNVAEANGGCYIEYFAIVDSFDVMALSTIRYDANWNGSDWGEKNIVFCSIMPKMSSGKLQVPASLICELLGYQYELKDTGFYITK